MLKITLVQKAVIIHPKDNNKFLLLVRNLTDKSRPGDFDIPGGSVKDGELPEKALIREIDEETNLQVTKVKPVFMSSKYDSEEGSYFLYIGYSALSLSDNITLNSEEHSAYTWISFDDFKAKYQSHILYKHVVSVFGEDQNSF